MSLKIRLARGGTKKRPHYRIVVADSRSPRDGRFIERLGVYDPMLPKEHSGRVTISEERVRHWLSVGALPSDRVGRFLSAAEIIPKAPIFEQTKHHLPKKKAQERARETAASLEESMTESDDEVQARLSTGKDGAMTEKAASEEVSDKEGSEIASTVESENTEIAVAESPVEEESVHKADEGVKTATSDVETDKMTEEPVKEAVAAEEDSQTGEPDKDETLKGEVKQPVDDQEETQEGVSEKPNKN